MLRGLCSEGFRGGGIDSMDYRDGKDYRDAWIHGFMDGKDCRDGMDCREVRDGTALVRELMIWVVCLSS